MLGDVASLPLTLPDRTILQPAIVSPLGPEGGLYSPTGGYTYTDEVVLHGRGMEIDSHGAPPSR